MILNQLLEIKGTIRVQIFKHSSISVLIPKTHYAAQKIFKCTSPVPESEQISHGRMEASVLMPCFLGHYVSVTPESERERPVNISFRSMHGTIKQNREEQQLNLLASVLLRPY